MSKRALKKRFHHRARRVPPHPYPDINTIAVRTWKQTSDRICWANSLPPGFRIALLDEDDDVVRSSVKIRSGDFGSFPRGFRVWAFLEQAVAQNVKDWGDVPYDSVQLRDHRNRPVDQNLTLREVRDMTGTGARHARSWIDNDLEVGALVDQIDDAVCWLTEEGTDPNEDLLLRALFRYITGKYEFPDVEYVSKISLEMPRKRYEHELKQRRK